MIVDAHHHLWRRAKTPWLDGPPVPRIFGSYDAIRRDYLIEEYLAEAAPCGVTQSVYVQVNVAPGEEVAEAAWVASVAAGYGIPCAITGFADLAAAGVEKVLDQQVGIAGLRAIRQQMHWHANPRYRFASSSDGLDDPAWRRGLAAVAARGLMFELQVFPSQMRSADRLVRDYPGMTFILVHAGMLEDRSEAGWAEWRQGMMALARQRNLHVKLSGLGTFLRSCTEADWRPVIEQTVDLFGPERCLFGSNFPIEKLWTSYAELVRVTQACLSRFSADEQAAIMRGTAAKLYGLAV